MTRKVKDELGDSLEALASDILKKAQRPGVDLDSQLQAMKAVSSYFAATRKLKGKESDEDESDMSFDKMRSKLKAVS